MATIRIPLEIINDNYENYEILNDRIDIQFDPCPILPDIQENNKDLLKCLFAVNSVKKKDEIKIEEQMEEGKPVEEKQAKEEPVEATFNLKRNPVGIKKRLHLSFKKYRQRINHTQKKYE